MTFNPAPVRIVRRRNPPLRDARENANMEEHPMKKYKIYLETTLFNFYFDTDREAHADTVRLFAEIAAGKHEAFTSEAVIWELRDAHSPKREKMLSLIDEYGIKTLPVGNEARNLADFYVEQKIISPKYKTDAIHIAVATVNKLDYIISMNFQHIVNQKTRRMTDSAHGLKGYSTIAIISPMEPII